MNKVRYPEKDLLCKYDLGEDIFRIFNVEVKNVIPLRKVFIVVTDQGKRILKIVNDNEESINELNDKLEKIRTIYPNILTYCRSINNKIVENISGNKYVLLDMNDGREASFLNPYEIKLCTEAIGKFHKASIEAIGKDITINKDSYVDELLKDVEELKYIKRLVEKFKYPNDFDNILKATIDYYINQSNRAISKLEYINYRNIEKDNRNYTMCHNDLAHHNFIVNGEEVFLIDFDYSKIGLKINDISMYINKVMKSRAYGTVEVSKSIINTYRGANDLSSEEIEGIKTLLSIPMDYISIVKSYYFKQKSWRLEVFINRFLNKINNEEYRQEFLKWFNKNI